MSTATIILASKAALGAGVVLLMSWLATCNLYFLIGLVPLFPTFAIIGHATSWTSGGAEAVRHASLFGLFALVPYAVYLIAVYLLVNRFSIVTSLSIAVAVWTASALLIIQLWRMLKF